MDQPLDEKVKEQIRKYFVLQADVDPSIAGYQRWVAQFPEYLTMRDAKERLLFRAIAPEFGKKVKEGRPPFKSSISESSKTSLGAHSTTLEEFSVDYQVSESRVNPETKGRGEERSVFKSHSIESEAGKKAVLDTPSNHDLSIATTVKATSILQADTARWAGFSSEIKAMKMLFSPLMLGLDNEDPESDTKTRLEHKETESDTMKSSRDKEKEKEKEKEKDPMNSYQQNKVTPARAASRVANTHAHNGGGVSSIASMSFHVLGSGAVSLQNENSTTARWDTVAAFRFDRSELPAHSFDEKPDSDPDALNMLIAVWERQDADGTSKVRKETDVIEMPSDVYSEDNENSYDESRSESDSIGNSQCGGEIDSGDVYDEEDSLVEHPPSLINTINATNAAHGSPDDPPVVGLRGLPGRRPDASGTLKTVDNYKDALDQPNR